MEYKYLYEATYLKRYGTTRCQCGFEKAYQSLDHNTAELPEVLTDLFM